MSLVENQRTALTTNALNAVATTSLGLGVLALVAASFLHECWGHVPVHSLALGVVFWSLAAATQVFAFMSCRCWQRSDLGCSPTMLIVSTSGRSVELIDKLSMRLDGGGREFEVRD